MYRHLFLTVLTIAPSLLFSQAREILPGENLSVEGIPPIPSTIVESAQRYAEFRGASFLSWHPTKLEMLISIRFADVPQVHWVKVPGGMRTQKKNADDQFYATLFFIMTFLLNRRETE